jgi:hypothetical protein
VKKYILYSTIWLIFLDDFFFFYKIQIKFVYFGLLVNFVLLLFYWDFKLHRNHVYALLYLWFSGLVAVLFGPDKLGNYLQQAIGITVVSTYFYLFIKYQPLSLEELFRVYAKGALSVSILGLAIVPFASLYLGRFSPVESISGEPTKFATIVFPAFYYYAANAIRERKDKGPALVMFVALILSGSAVGFLGILIAIILFTRHRTKYLIFAPVILLLLGALIYGSDPHFRVRVDDTFNVFKLGDVSGANLSTFALMSNAYVTGQVLQERPLFGYGIGGHIIAHEKFVGGLTGTDTLAEWLHLNAIDADSLLLRTGSELGIVGLILVFVFLFKLFVRGRQRYSEMSAAILIYFALKLIRAGHWFPAELYFFVWLYVFLWLASRQVKESGAAGSTRSQRNAHSL